MAITDTLSEIAGAIRRKTGKSAQMQMKDMAGEILSISSGGGAEPALGFVPAEWDEGGFVTKGKWIGLGGIPPAFFTGFSASTGQYLRMADIEGLENVTSIGSYAFRYCNGLTSVKFSELLTSLGTYAFQSCTALEKADLSGTPGFSNGVFSGCSSLAALILRGDLISLPHINVFTGTPISAGSGYVYVPAELLDTYKSATNWVTLADQIRAIEDYPEITGGVE